MKIGSFRFGFKFLSPFWILAVVVVFGGAAGTFAVAAESASSGSRFPYMHVHALTMDAAGEAPKAIAKATGMPLPMVGEFLAKQDKAPKAAKTPKVEKPKPVKKKPAKKAGKKDAKPESKKARIDNLIASINTHHKREVITRASDVMTSYLLRRPSGILSFDLALAGGWPAGALSVITGPDGAGKDYHLNRAIAECQRIYGDDCAVVIYSTEFKFDKLFARNMCGVQVALTDEEIAEINHSRLQHGQEPLSEEERKELQTEVGRIILIEGVIAEDGLDIVLDCVASNEFQIVAINSLGVLQTAAKEDTDSLRDFAQQSNEAILVSKFMPKLLKK